MICHVVLHGRIIDYCLLFLHEEHEKFLDLISFLYYALFYITLSSVSELVATVNVPVAIKRKPGRPRKCDSILASPDMQSSL
jgi:hypothetical protein